MRQRKGRRQRQLLERRSRPRSSFSSPSVTARRPRSREPATLLSRSSKVSLLPASVHARGQADVLRQRIRRLEIEQRRRNRRCELSELRLALASCAHGSAEPSASASSPVPEIFALSRNGAPHAPAAVPSNCAGPSPAATVRSRPSSGKQRAALLRRQFRFDPDFAAPERCRDRCHGSPRPAGLAVIVVTPLSCGESRSSYGARLDAIGTARHSWSRSSVEFQARRARARPHRIEPRGQRRCKRERSGW